MKTYHVKEIFGPTVQGEGSHTGTVVKFLRFTGCNKWSGREQDKAQSVCWFCDTDFLGGERLSIEDICTRLEALGPCKNLVISGGEPTLQLDEPLLIALKNQSYNLHLETNGSMALTSLANYFTHITMSPKQNRSETKLEQCHDVKILYPSPIKEVKPQDFQDFPAKNYYLQPLDEPNKKDAHTEAALNYCLNNPAWKLSLQIHKMIGVP